MSTFRIKSIRIGDVFVDEVDGMTPRHVALLAERGLVFCTAFKIGEKTLSGNIIAASEDDAQRIASERGLGEEIIGKTVLETE